jgi:uncharacterized protein YifN (PemK superfamily)
MTMLFYPRMGHVLMGDFSDLKEPEMTKVRPVIVVSPRLPFRSEIVAVVPISLTEPRHKLPYCFRLSKNYHPKEDAGLPCWAKADMIMNIALRRLDGFKVGRRQWHYPEISAEDLAGVRHAVLCGLSLDRIEKTE